jgi:enamine deaminase RidA (YjgF/YER057c/UK114 family)
MTHTLHNIGVSERIGTYSDAAEVAANIRWLITSGTPGLPTDGSSLPNTITAQAELAWQHIVRMLTKADMSVGDIVKVTQYLTRAEDISEYASIRTKYLGDARPASMLSVVSQLVWPDILVEIEIVAAKAIG